MPRPMTPAEIAEIDQTLAMAGDELNQLLEIIRDLAAGHGRVKALADIACLLARQHPARIQGLLLTALWRLAWQEEAGDEEP